MLNDATLLIIIINIHVHLFVYLDIFLPLNEESSIKKAWVKVISEIECNIIEIKKEGRRERKRVEFFFFIEIKVQNNNNSFFRSKQNSLDL